MKGFGGTCAERGVVRVNGRLIYTVHEIQSDDLDSSSTVTVGLDLSNGRIWKGEKAVEGFDDVGSAQALDWIGSLTIK